MAREQLSLDADSAPHLRGSMQPHDDGRPSRGLVNLGNTCFLNAAVQALGACEPFVTHLSVSAPLIKLRHKQTSQNGAPLPAELTNAVSKLFAELFRSERGSGAPLSPDHLVRAARRISPALAGHGQCDSQEFVSALLDALHEQLKRPLSDRELLDLSEVRARRWKEATGEEWKDEAKMAYEASEACSGHRPSPSSPSLRLRPPPPPQPPLPTPTPHPTPPHPTPQAQLKQREEAAAARAKTDGTAISPPPPPPPPRPQTSLVSSLFEGQLLSTVTCEACEKQARPRTPPQSLSPRSLNPRAPTSSPDPPPPASTPPLVPPASASQSHTADPFFLLSLPMPTRAARAAGSDGLASTTSESRKLPRR